MPGALFGRKAFIVAVWEAMPASSRGELPHFKERLLGARRLGQVSLARADLAAMMDTRLVARSETNDHGATFHFVVSPDIKDLWGAMIATIT
jgi:hypothetical protein